MGAHIGAHCRSRGAVDQRINSRRHAKPGDEHLFLAGQAYLLRVCACLVR